MNNNTQQQPAKPQPTVARNWEEFAGKCINPNAPHRDREILRRAFYAGAIALYKTIIYDVGVAGDVEGPLVLELLESEMRTFARDCVNEPLH